MKLTDGILNLSEDKIFYLPIRSFGDFIITAYVVKNNSNKRIPIILPEYLIDLFNAVGASEYFDLKNTIGFKDQPAFFELYKITDWDNFRRLLRDTSYIYNHCSAGLTYLLDYHSKRLFFVNTKFKWPLAAQNIYVAKKQLFAENFRWPKTSNLSLITMISKVKTITIFPESRINSKEINHELIENIIDRFKFVTIRVATFLNENIKYKQRVAYLDFKQLINLICTSDLIISAESLPYHLANLYNKPHFVIYNETRHFNKNFMTPFMISNKYYSTYNGKNIADIINKLGGILD